jgi:hypothetical protein
MSEEILTKESEEMTEEELAEKRKAAAEQDSSDGEEEDDEEEVEEGKSTKASVKKEQEDDEEEDDEEEVEESKASVKKEEGEEDDEEEEEEVPAESKKAKKESVIPSTKNQMLKNIYDEVNKMLKSDLAGKYEQIMASTSMKQVKEETRTQAAVTTEDIGPINVQDDIDALTKGEDGLSDDFKAKATTIFEAAVHAKVVDEINTRMEQQAKEQEAGSQEFQKELTEKVDGYLTYVVEEWMKENELAIERGIRSELVEDFMSGLKTLFTEHYIDLPEEKVDMVDDLFTKVEDLETSLDEEINRGVELQKELAQFKKDDALKLATKDLADTDSEKISKLAEGIEFENTEQYIEKLNVLKESYFPKSDAVTSEITETDETIEVSDEKQEIRLDESMKHYTSAIKRYNS